MRANSVAVVVAAWPDLRGVRDCLRSIVAQSDEAVSIIVTSIQEADTEMAREFSKVEWLPCPKARFIPHLWARGIANAQGEIIAVTIAHCLPASDWIEQIRSAHNRLAAAGIGGKLEPPSGGNPVEWATYFLRYSNYLHYDRDQAVTEIAADNASYKNEALQSHAAAIADGFWEPDLHRLFFAEGKTLAFVPEIRVQLQTHIEFTEFLRQRLHHGRHFGAERAAGGSKGLRWARIISSPLIPFVLLAKVTARVLRSRKYWSQFVISLPALVAFIVAWGAGELWGYFSNTADNQSAN